MGKVKIYCHNHREELNTIKIYLLVVAVLSAFAYIAIQ
jgi:hypothetical protein